MGRRRLATAVVVLAVLLGALPALTPAPPVAAQVGAIGLEIDCAANPERTTITNATDSPLALGSFQLTSLYRPLAGIEPFPALPGGDLPPGASITYLTGEAAPARTLTLTRHFIYDNVARSEGARLITPYGILVLFCETGDGSLTVGPRPPPAPEVPPPALTTSPLCFPGHTQHCTAGAFRARWEGSGGLPINGYPLGALIWEVLEDGNGHWVQYFERVRMEWHPAEPDPQYRVQLGQFGRCVLKDITGREADPPAMPVAGLEYDPVTGHHYDPRFLPYWLANGGLAQFGRPLTETFRQVLEDGREYDVQYFERARFEWHPDEPEPYRVLLGQFGRRVCGARC